MRYRPNEREPLVSKPKTIRILCPNLRCRRLLAVPANARGKVVVCKSCGTRIMVPGEHQREPTETPAAEASPDQPQQKAG
jgi:DNA-directed RNA polymerase subunit RPC12/RpoP